MKIGIDILGGDFAPDANIAGAVLARKELPQDVTLVLIGDQDQILSGLNALNATTDGFEVVHAPDIVFASCLSSSRANRRTQLDRYRSRLLKKGRVRR